LAGVWSNYALNPPLAGGLRVVPQLHAEAAHDTAMYERKALIATTVCVSEFFVHALSSVHLENLEG